MSLMIAMYHSRELYNAEVKNIYEDRTTDSFFDRQFF